MAAYSANLSPTTLAWNMALFGTGALVMRGAGCTINDLWDRKIDNKVGTSLRAHARRLRLRKLTTARPSQPQPERTKMRPLASGEVTPTQAVTFLAGQLSLGLAVLTQLNLYS